MHEFTGERVIPGLVDADLFNEHLSRYRFAARFVRPGMTVLDAGCGTGYGTAELAHARRVAAIDISTEAAGYAATHYARANTHFAAASCAAMPFADGAFDLITAFEVIEHLGDYRALLGEARRVLSPGGILLVSTPNRAYYAESRAGAGPNPFHVHEFDYPEFREALEACFANVEIWTQNHTGTIVFAPPDGRDGFAERASAGDPAEAHFFVAACSDRPVFAGVRGAQPLFAFIPSVANTLRERELHIAKLEAMLEDALERHEVLEKEHEATVAELERSNKWAERLDGEIARLGAEITRLGAEISQRDAEAAIRLEWIRDLEGQIARGGAHIEKLNAELTSRTEWAQSLDSEVARLRAELERSRAELAMIAQSRWMRLGRTLNVSPEVNGK